MQDAEQAAADQFPCRDLFRHGKAQFVYHVLLQGENNGIYLRGGSAAKLDYPLNEASVSHLAQVILDIQNTYLKDTQVHCYYSIVPDKNAYLAGWYPTMDYHRLTPAAGSASPHDLCGSVPLPHRGFLTTVQTPTGGRMLCSLWWRP